MRKPLVESKTKLETEELLTTRISSPTTVVRVVGGTPVVLAVVVVLVVDVSVWLVDVELDVSV